MREDSFWLPKDDTELLSSEILKEIVETLEKKLYEIEHRNSTCKLWITYCKMIFIVLDFIFAEKSGNWELHLKTIERMIPFFHATGHFSYAKSSTIYLQDMRKLKETMGPVEYKNFCEKGFWTSRRTHKFFSGIFTDQTIEQTLMRMLKCEGGLFKQGVTESVAYQWIQGLVFTKDIVEGMEEFTGTALKETINIKMQLMPG